MENQTQTKARGEEVFSFDPRDYKIIKETTPDNEVIYRHPMGGTILTYQKTLEDLMDSNLNKIQNLIDLIGDDAYECFGYIAEALLRDIWRTQNEAFSWLNKHSGRFQFDLVSRGDNIYREDRLLNISLKKPAEIEEN